MNNHICVFYEILQATGIPVAHAAVFDGQDSLGAEFVPFAILNESNSSLLVLKAKEFFEQQQFIIRDQTLPTWEVKA